MKLSAADASRGVEIESSMYVSSGAPSMASGNLRSRRHLSRPVKLEGNAQMPTAYAG